ncbi:MAG: hypothetical protein KatS3mg002_0850 [Candidatus Woesearchaeota archaeon]|nr:MAG: hypothetical protein KatS3mg002_0850 [Candidatus Woesearchaeota archaeon]
MNKTIKSLKKSKSTKTLFREKFCPKCGKTIKGASGICSECNISEFKFKDIHIILCNSCHSFKHANKWTGFKNFKNVIKKVAESNIKASIKIKRIPIEIEKKILNYKEGVREDITIPIIYSGNIFDIPAKVETTLCEKCSRKNTQYFESILQLRNCNKEVLEFAKNDIKKQFKKGIYLTKEQPLEKHSIKNIDLYITNQTYAKTLAEKIRKNFGGIIKKNAKHFSLDWQTSKTVYRLNVLVQLPIYKKNDVIKHDNHLYKIVSLGEKIRVVDLANNHKTSLSNKDSYIVLHPSIFQVIKKYPEYEVLDPNTYYQAKLMNPSKKLEINQKIKVVIDGSEAWMI